MESSGQAKIFRVTASRRASYPAAGLLCVAIALWKYFAAGDALLIKACVVIVPFCFFMGIYLQLIVLKISEKEISLTWPGNPTKKLEWDSITQVRRSSSPPGRSFFVDLISTPDKSIQFNPFLFDNSRDIILSLDQRLKFELLDNKSEFSENSFAELAITQDREPEVHKNYWGILLALAGLLICILLYSLRG